MFERGLMKFDADKLKKLEKIRLILLRRSFVGIVLAIVYCLIVFGLINPDDKVFYIVLIVVGIIVFAFINRNLVTKLKESFFDAIVCPILERYSLKAINTPDSQQEKLIERDLEKLGIFEYDRSSFGKIFYNDDIKICNICLEEKVDDDKKTKYISVFDGAFVKIKFDYQCDIYALSSIYATCKKQKLHLDNAEFNKLYKTYSDDVISAFKLLTPAFMQKVLNNNIKCDFCYVDNALYIFYDINILDFNIFKDIDESGALKYFNETKNLFDLIDILTLKS